MENLTNFIINKIDLSLSYNEMCAKFLEDIDKNDELSEQMYSIPTDTIKKVFVEIYMKHYNRDDIEVKKEIKNYKLIEYTKCKFVHAVTEKNEHLIFNSSVGFKMSNTAFNKFIKKYSLDDLTRPRLYALFHNTLNKDDNFLNYLKNNGVVWKPIKVKNSSRIHYRYPEISA